jgi:ribosomal protein S18 acetylase RimI-like enzyme
MASVSAGLQIEEITEVQDDVLLAMVRLVTQLSGSAVPPGRAELEEITRSSASRLLIARSDDGSILGTLTLALFRIPTGMRAWIEDVVVDETALRRGVGEALTAAALSMAHDVGARTVDLTSRPTREAANRLYRRLGFEPRETTVYRFDSGAGRRGRLT